MSTNEALLRGMKLVQGADQATVSRLESRARAVKVASGALVFRKGDRADELVCVRRGIVQIIRPTPVPVTVGLLGPREPIGLSALLDRGTYPADAVAVGEVEVVRVPASVVLACMETDAGFLRAVNQALLDHTRALQAKIDMLTAGTVSARLATLVRHLAARFGDEDESGETFVPVVLSRGDLARLVGARTETVIRVLSGWQRKGLIATTERGFVVKDPSALA